MMANNIAPNLYRKSWGFQSWLGYNQQIWEEVLEEAHDVVQTIILTLEVVIFPNLQYKLQRKIYVLSEFQTFRL